MDFNGTRALVTGASSGIGAVFARELANKGADLVLVARPEAKLEELASQIRERHPGRSVEVLPADLAEMGASARLVAQLVERGLQIDVLINNAGFGMFARLHEADAGRVSEMVQLNVTSLT